MRGALCADGVCVVSMCMPGVCRRAATRAFALAAHGRLGSALPPAMASSSAGVRGATSKAGAPGPPNWQRETARRVDKRERRHEERGPERFPLKESLAFKKLLKEESHKLARAVLEVRPGDAVGATAIAGDFPELAVSVAKHQRQRLALKPARFEPQEGTRIIEGRPVQALRTGCLKPCPRVSQRRCGRLCRAGGGGGRWATGT